jgi:hypothetical protein
MDSLEVSVARVEEKLDGLIDRFDRREADDKEALQDLKKRVDALERWRAALLGGSAAVGAVISLIANRLLALLH